MTSDPLNLEALAEAYERALALEKAGDAQAVDAWRSLLALDPRDPGGAALRLAALGAAETPAGAPGAYVATLFDQHAEVFDGILVEQLEYGAPMLLRERLQSLRLGPFSAMLDLGCGTGLAAEALEDMTASRVGVDLAAEMIGVAGEKDVYDRLFVGDAVRFLAETDARFDLIVATDVFPYIGDLAPFLTAASRAATDRALLAASTESLPPANALVSGGGSWRVTAHHRFAHDRDYIVRAMAAAGWSLLDTSEIMVRREMGSPILGDLLIARRAGSARAA